MNRDSLAAPGFKTTIAPLILHPIRPTGNFCSTARLRIPFVSEPAHSDAEIPVAELVDDAAQVSFEEASPDLVAERAGVDVTSYRLPDCPHPLRRPFGAIAWLVRALFGIGSLIVLLALIAAIPIVNFLALGYLLEVEARVARTGKLRNAFLLLDVAPRIGSIALGVWLWLIPLRYLGLLRNDAYWLDPDGPASRRLEFFVPLAAVLVGMHLCFALARGGSLTTFFRPIKNVRWLLKHWQQGDYWVFATAGIQDVVKRLRLKHHFLLGVRGFFGALLWLALPSALLAAGNPEKPATFLLSVIGGVLLLLVLCWVPFLQARFAMTGRWRTMFQLSSIRQLFCFAPFAWLTAIVLTYLLSFPLLLSKVYLLPQDARWLVTLIFIVSIYPAKVVTGWAMHRALKRQDWPWFGWRWMVRALLLPLLGIYVFILFFTPLISEHGRAVLFEHHALLLPAPALW